MEFTQETDITETQPPPQSLSENQINFQQLQHMQAANSIDRHYTPQLKFTNFAAQPPIVTKYVTSKFLRHDISYFNRDESNIGSKVLVIHPGSRYLRIGRASEAFPIVVPHVIARRIRNRKEHETQQEEEKKEIKVEVDTEHVHPVHVKIKKEKEKKEMYDEDAKETESCSNSAGSSVATEEEDEDEEHFKQAVGEIKKELKEKIKASKRRPVANAQSQVHSFNKSVHPEIIADHNDPYRVDWTLVDEDAEYYVGEKALRLLDSDDSFNLFYPIQNGEFNTRDYDSIKAVIGDLETIWSESIQEKIGISQKNFRIYSVILIIPDIYNRLYVLEMITMLLRYMGFRRVFVAQESICVSFGAGMSVACIVDIGAQTSTITCVEDGMCIPDSRVYLHYGSDDITNFFIRLLKRSKFPYSDMDLNRAYDWSLAEELKEKICTLDEANLTIQLNEFYVRAPNKPTLKYHIKTYDDAIISPMLLFYPHVINFNKKRTDFPQKFASYTIDDITDGAITNNGD
ncbi:4928_t:CDS:2 [Funneliformis mosseae]|uniref:4928_t:CDS:1 n=1 Tax=Funneliformis mosseae TaxID=27381 RepID=A0A9N9HJ20_FUNMO|nr:4928_t:CDS:2 [Funneliformis mosseae]